MEDRVFVAIAKKAGYPSRDQLTRLRALQRQREIDGKSESLEALARSENALDAVQLRRFERWAIQVAEKGKAEPLIESDDAHSSTRVIAEDSGRFGREIDENREDVDELIRRFAAGASGAAAALPQAAPKAEPPKPALAKTASASRLATAKGRGRGSASASAGASVLAIGAALAAVVIAAIALSPSETPTEPVVARQTPVEPKKPAPVVAPQKSPDTRAPDPMAPDEPGPGIDDFPAPQRDTGVELTPAPTPDKAAPEPSKAEGGPKADPGTPAKKPALVPGQPYIEKFPDGKVKLRYETDMKGQRSGDYAEFHENGKPKIKARYAAGELTGTFTEFFATGKTKRKLEYKKDQLHGHAVELDEKGKLVRDQVWFDGHLIFPRTQAEIAAALAEIEASPVADAAAPAKKATFTPLEARAQTQGLRRLRAYRYLCNVQWDVDLSADYGELCQAAARLLDLVGHLDHTPKRPGGCSDDLYEKGYAGTSQSNLYMGSGNTVEAIDCFMDDSDPKNVDRVGHRRWCIDPPMKKTAFGSFADKWVAFYAFDKERTDTKEPDFCPYPAPGYFPSNFVRGNAAWSCSLSAAHFSEPKPEEVTVKVCPADERLKNGPPATIDSFNVNLAPFGQPWCVIFRPRVSTRPGARYSVEIKGLKDVEGKPVPILYWVEFFNP